MAIVLVKEDSVLQATADAIRAKKNVTTKYTPGEMAAAISSISGNIAMGNINLTNYSTTYNVTNYATAKIVDSNLKAANIRKGVSILGITGSTVVETSDANATAALILKGKTAWVNGAKITGTAQATVSGTTATFPTE